MKVYGIDLGTTNSCISICQNGIVTVLENLNGNKTTPSVVALKNGEWLVGENAKNQLEVNNNTILSIKRLMGTDQKVILEENEYRPEYISAKILDYLVKAANQKMGEDIKDVIITVPAYFDDAQRNATKLAGELVGLNVKRLINEPTAAAISYGIQTNKQTEETRILVFDLGGGTFDLSILEIQNNDFEVIATDGDNELGGDDWDNVIVDFIKQYCKKNLKIKSFDKTMELRLKVAAETAKKNLSSQTQTHINIPFFSMENNEPKHVDLELQVKDFENDSKFLLQKIELKLNNILKNKNLNLNDINKIVMVGGSTRMKMIQNFIENYFSKDKISFNLNVDEAVSIGASMLGESAFNNIKNELILMDVTPISLGTTLDKDVFDILIPKNSTIPISVTKEYTTTRDWQELVEIDIRQGENPKGSKNKLIGEFILEGIEKAPKEVASLMTKFSLDVNGILTVTAFDLKTKVKESIKITNALSIKDEEKIALIEMIKKDDNKY